MPNYIPISDWRPRSPPRRWERPAKVGEWWADRTTGGADPRRPRDPRGTPTLQPHHQLESSQYSLLWPRNKARRQALAKRFRDPDDPLKLVIVRDMWLTDFDAPCLHTMYVDKPMQGHGLMQAIARVNRKFSDKPGGLVVDYLGLADGLKRALTRYTRAGARVAQPSRKRTPSRRYGGNTRSVKLSSTASPGRNGESVRQRSALASFRPPKSTFSRSRTVGRASLTRWPPS